MRGRHQSVGIKVICAEYQHCIAVFFLNNLYCMNNIDLATQLTHFYAITKSWGIVVLFTRELFAKTLLFVSLQSLEAHCYCRPRQHKRIYISQQFQQALMGEYDIVRGQRPGYAEADCETLGDALFRCARNVWVCATWAGVGGRVPSGETMWVKWCGN